MYKIAAVCLGTIFLAGCNATVYQPAGRPRPLISVQPAYPVYSYPVQPQYTYRQPNCYLVDRPTPYGVRTTRVCQ